MKKTTADRKKILLRLALLLGTASMTAPVMAHHSTAMYDYAKSITLTGTVDSFEWTNPHMFIKVTVPNAQGNDVQWNIECGTVNINARHGWKRTDIKHGDKVTVEFHPTRDSEVSAGTLMQVKLADGRILYSPGGDILAAPGSDSTAAPSK